ncbi:hypothetical protein [Dankookia sp. P2]|uniref:hypothetical protein n=1 Tax=Dankookia sp. P2 TaxID=3423955 RepID=UPI003D67A05A
MPRRCRRASMVAAALLAAGGIAPRAGLLGLAVGDAPIAWGRRAAAVVMVSAGTVLLQPGPAAQGHRAL